MGELEDWIHNELRKGKHHLRVVEDLVGVGHDSEEVHKLVLEVHSARKHRKLLTVGVLSMVVFLGLVLFLVVSNSSPSSSVISTDSSEGVVNLSAQGLVDQEEYVPVVRVADVRVSLSGMSPSRLPVRVGDEITFRTRSTDGVTYQIVQPELGLEFNAGPDSSSVTFVVTESGDFLFRVVDGFEEQGMYLVVNH